MLSGWLPAICKTRFTPAFDKTRQTVLLAALLMPSAIPAAAEEPYGSVNYVMPEAVLKPIRTRNGLRPNDGWILVYRNQFTTPQTSNRDLQSQKVGFRSKTGTWIEDHISWQIAQSENTSCTDPVGGPCPDTIRVISVPAGFVAVPDSATLSERGMIEIYIFRPELG